MIQRHRAPTLLLTLAAVTGCLHATVGNTQGKDTLWTELTAKGETISLEWASSHPWNALLTASGAQLVAVYHVDGRREIREAIARGDRVPGEDRMLQFQLPETLKNAPVGSVCLLVEAPNRRTLPIRRASDSDRDTGGFRYKEWEQQVRSTSEAQEIRVRVATGERVLATSATAISQREASLAERGWDNPQACETISVPRSGPPLRPVDVIDLSEQADAARQLCVYRVRRNYSRAIKIEGILGKAVAGVSKAEAREYLSEPFRNAFGGPVGISPDDLLKQATELLGTANETVKARAPQIQEFLGEWSRWATGGSDYQPPLAGEELGWQQSAREAALRLFGPALAKQLGAEEAMQGVARASQSDLEAVLGASLDAYAGCVDDSRKQLKLKLDAWEALRAAAPERAAATRDFFVRECRQQFLELGEVKKQASMVQESLDRDRTALAATTAPKSRLPSKKQNMNSSACTDSK
jgi:hypothetical protein